MIRGRCRTNIDEYKREEWPSVFVAVPRRGEWVQAKSGKVLTVVMVTHYVDAGNARGRKQFACDRSGAAPMTHSPTLSCFRCRSCWQCLACSINGEE
jgi:hypothetical protein